MRRCARPSGPSPAPAAARRSGRAGRCVARAGLGGEEVDDDVAAPRPGTSGMNSAIAAPAAKPVSSKAPTMVQPIVLRPIRLTQVISVMTISSTPARMAHSLAACSSSFTRRSLAGSSGAVRARLLSTALRAVSTACRAARRVRRAVVSTIWHDSRLVGRRGAAVISSIACSSDDGGGRRAAQAGSTMTWQVAQVRQPPQSAAMPSMPASTAARIRLCRARLQRRGAAVGLEQVDGDRRRPRRQKRLKYSRALPRRLVGGLVVARELLPLDGVEHRRPSARRAPLQQHARRRPARPALRPGVRRQRRAAPAAYGALGRRGRAARPRCEPVEPGEDLRRHVAGRGWPSARRSGSRCAWPRRRRGRARAASRRGCRGPRRTACGAIALRPEAAVGRDRRRAQRRHAAARAPAGRRASARRRRRACAHRRRRARPRVAHERVARRLRVDQRLVQVPAAGHRVRQRRPADEAGVVAGAAQRLAHAVAEQHHLVGGGQRVGRRRTPPRTGSARARSRATAAAGPAPARCAARSPARRRRRSAQASASRL